jgi:hypothetical protein
MKRSKLNQIKPNKTPMNLRYQIYDLRFCCRVDAGLATGCGRRGCRLAIGDTAGCQPALRCGKPGAIPLAGQVLRPVVLNRAYVYLKFEISNLRKGQ